MLQRVSLLSPGNLGWIQVDSYASMGSWLDSFVGEVFPSLARSDRPAQAGFAHQPAGLFAAHVPTAPFIAACIFSTPHQCGLRLQTLSGPA